ncbi:MAG: hypothetical protein CL920_20350 [Deltaproteobacteria bacterium]|nr:hypothetical protein [Deltaproteobacteria bacterium]MBU51044.1 hypothetical protein [Deltaproteobacteria bacterium]
MFVKKGIFFTLSSMLLVLFVACSSTVPSTDQLQNLGAVDAKGAKVCGLGTCLDFPEGAVDAKMDIKARILEEQNDQSLGPVYEFVTTNETFKKEIKIELPVPASAKDEELEVAFYKDGEWVAVPTTKSTDGMTRIGLSNHFSKWTVRRKPPTNSKACKAHADCARGEICDNGACKAGPNTNPNGCSSDADCIQNKVCLNGTCQTRTNPNTCTSDADCARGEICNPMTRTCKVQNGGCTPTKEVCGDRIDNDCDGIVDEGCNTNPGGCSSDADCIQNKVCVRGTCQARTPPAGCTSDADCIQNKICVRGTCQTRPAPNTCTSNADCARGEVCQNGTCQTNTNPGGCSSDADCIQNKMCLNGTCQTRPAPNTCTSDADCARGEVCDATTRTCKVQNGGCTPTKEVCGDRIDNDCDGIVDEGCNTNPGGCSSDADCIQNKVCLNGTCQTRTNPMGCRSDADCAPSQTCTNNGVCR